MNYENGLQFLSSNIPKYYLKNFGTNFGTIEFKMNDKCYKILLGVLLNGLNYFKILTMRKDFKIFSNVENIYVYFLRIHF